MGPSKLLFPALLGLLAIFAMRTPALAAKKRAPETYSAYEGGNSDQPEGEVKPQAVLSSPKKAHAKFLKKAHAKNEIEAPGTEAGKTSFDPVPEQQREPIARRLKLVEELLIKFGRAYDYRVHTSKELESILSQLEANMPAPPPPPSDGQNS